MAKLNRPVLSVVVPVYNEAAGLEAFHQSLIKVLGATVQGDYELIYIDDGSDDDSQELIKGFHEQDQRVKLVRLSRNFGKENALSAGIAEAEGQAVLTLDGDGQHPVELIPKFIEAWKNGSQVVIGLGTGSRGEGWLRRVYSSLFYKTVNLFTGQKLLAGTTDFRLIDAEVQQAFLSLKENDRITRGLIDWLGFSRSFVEFTVEQRVSGQPTYSRRKLANLAINSFVSLSPMPLYIFGYLGICITVAAFILGLAVFIEQPLLGDPLHWKFTGTAMLSILLLFLVGLVLLSQGILSLYVAHTHNQAKRRPLYVIDYKHSLGLGNKADE